MSIDKLLKMIANDMKVMLPKMSDNGLIQAYEFSKIVMKDVIEEFKRRGMKWVE